MTTTITTPEVDTIAPEEAFQRLLIEAANLFGAHDIPAPAKGAEQRLRLYPKAGGYTDEARRDGAALVRRMAALPGAELDYEGNGFFVVSVPTPFGVIDLAFSTYNVGEQRPVMSESVTWVLADEPTEVSS